ncbi:MAG TPA: cytochrome P450 [Candidatus Binatia bacterium]|nr:cytochrome P450 [Candidatus Binatia bacterium]
MIAGAIDEEETDFIRSVAYPLPVTVIAEIIGVPTSDMEQFKTWSDAAVENLGTGLFVPPSQERVDRIAKLIGEMGAYFSPLADDRLRQPREDLLTGLVRAEHEGSRLTREEMVRMLVLLLVAGNETTTTLIGDTVLELLAHPAELAKLRARPELIEAAIEETMRFASPVQLDPRRSVRDTDLHGFAIHENQLVVCWIGSANHDQSVFADPDRFDIERTGNSHLGFGFGPHYCLGANLARLEARIVTDVLLARTKSFELASSERLPLHPSIALRLVPA